MRVTFRSLVSPNHQSFPCFDSWRGCMYLSSRRNNAMVFGNHQILSWTFHPFLPALLSLSRGIFDSIRRIHLFVQRHLLLNLVDEQADALLHCGKLHLQLCHLPLQPHFCQALRKNLPILKEKLSSFSATVHHLLARGL